MTTRSSARGCASLRRVFDSPSGKALPADDAFERADEDGTRRLDAGLRFESLMSLLIKVSDGFRVRVLLPNSRTGT